MMNGIDISAWQGESNINLSKIPFDFCIVKATEGTYYRNRYFEKHSHETLSLKKLLGVYHYAAGGDPQKEAECFIEYARKYVGKAILVLDWEAQNNPRFGHNDLEWCIQWCNHVQKKTGIKPLIYIQKSAMDAVKKSGYGLWVAQYPDSNTTGYQEHPWNEGAYNCIIRQYTSVGRLPGYDGNLDLNKAYISSASWKKQASRIVNTSSSTSKPTTTKKSVNTLAKEILAGKWGNGPDRKARLTKAGYDYAKVQAAVNKLVKASQLTQDKIINAVAHEVISGKWGNGQERIDRLKAAGYNVSVVQARVNALLR